MNALYIFKKGKKKIVEAGLLLTALLLYCVLY
jgi:hypothetical protein